MVLPLQAKNTYQGIQAHLKRKNQNTKQNTYQEIQVHLKRKIQKK